MTAEKRARTALALYETGMSMEQIGEQLGVSRQRVNQMIRSVSDYKRETVAEQLKDMDMVPFLIECRQHGMSYRGIEALLGFSVSSLRKSIPANKRKLIRTPEHGTTNKYTRGCRCELCKAANSEWKRSYNATLRSKGLCIKCRVPSETWICGNCREKWRKRSI